MLPREKLQRLGASHLTNAELLAILLGSGSAAENVFELSNRVASQPDFQKCLLEQQVEYWTKVPGIGLSKATRLVASMELSKRMLFKPQSIQKISCAKDAYDLLLPQVIGEMKESFFVICLNTKNEVLLSKKIHVGFCDQVITDMKILFSTVLQTGAKSFVCVHNHPSGDVTPSEEDKDLTRKILESARLLDLCFLDHVIVAVAGYHSLFDHEPNLFRS